MLERWPRVEGVIVSARVADSTGTGDDVKMCSAVYVVRYAARGRDYSNESGGHTFTGNCPSVVDDVKAAPGRKVVVLHDPDDPRIGYTNPGFNTEFFLAAFILACLAAAFALAGLIAWKLGVWMDRRGIELP